jgi:integrase
MPSRGSRSTLNPATEAARSTADALATKAGRRRSGRWPRVLVPSDHWRRDRGRTPVAHALVPVLPSGRLGRSPHSRPAPGRFDLELDSVGVVPPVLTKRPVRKARNADGGAALTPRHFASVRLRQRVSSSERGPQMTAVSIVNWFAGAFRAVGLEGCSSHSGRRTFITRAARVVHRAGASLRDVQLLAGHRSIQTTQRYIDGDTDAQRKLVSLI